MDKKSFWVLIVEDDPLQASFCAKFLSRFNGRFEATVALTSEAALEKLSARVSQPANDRQHVILLDYYLHDETAAELLPKLLKLAPEAVVIVVTAYESPDLVTSTLNAGATDYFYKTPDYYKQLPRLIEVACDRWLEKRQLEEALARARQHETELANTLVQLERAQMQLIQSEKMLAIRQLVSGMSHEINNSLTSLIGFAQLLLSKQPDDRALKIIVDEAQHAHHIIKKLLTFSGQHKPESRWFDFNQLLKRVLDVRAYQFKVSDIEVVMDLAVTTPLIFGDENLLQQAFLNLIINAEMALTEAPPPRQINIVTETTDKYLVVTVKDNGPGIPEDVIGKIFDPFFTTRPHGEGVGLGLSVCYGIVQEHNGKIEVANDNGACFQVSLPLAPLPKREALPVSAVDDSQRFRLLVADDEEAIRLLMVEYLRQEGYQVDVATDGQEALNKAEEQHYDAYLIDCRMPGIDGVEFYRKLKEESQAAAERIIFITGDTANKRILNFLREVDNPHIVKPFDIDDVDKALKSLLQAKTRQGQ